MTDSSSSSSTSSCSNNIEECPLCLEILDLDDKSFFPCTCGYQICRFCWHRIRSETDSESKGSCPACRKPYTENPANFKPLSVEDVQQKLKAQKRQKDQLKKQKTVDSRRHLADLRVVQKNLVFVVGITPRIADPQLLKKNEYFGKFGKIHKIVVNNVTQQPPSAPAYGAYITYIRSEDALRAIQSTNNIPFDGKTIKASLGTTKYCSHFMRNQNCPKPECMYLHHHGDQDASFTKEDMQIGKHQEYEKKLIEEFNAANYTRKIHNTNNIPNIKNNTDREEESSSSSSPVAVLLEEPEPLPLLVATEEEEDLTTLISDLKIVEQQEGEEEEDDLGFDPFYETQKAFEKLIQEQVNISYPNNYHAPSDYYYPQQQHQQHHQHQQQPPITTTPPALAPTAPPSHQQQRSIPPGFISPWQQQQQPPLNMCDSENWMNLDPAIIFSSPTTNREEQEQQRHLLGNNLLADVFSNSIHLSHRQPSSSHRPQSNNHVVGQSIHHVPQHHVINHHAPAHTPAHAQQQQQLPLQQLAQFQKVLNSPPPGFSQQQFNNNNNNNFFYQNHFPF